MPTKKQASPSKFPLRLMPSLSVAAKQISKHEGVSLNQFINIAVAEKVAHVQHEAWLARRAKLSASSIDRALHLLDRPGGPEAEPGDELPEGYARSSPRAARREIAKVRA